MENLITPSIKDDVLSYIVANYDLNALYSRCELKPLLEIVGSKSNLQAIFNQFIRIGLIGKGTVSSLAYSISVNIEAHDFLFHGGFIAQEEILKANINKLSLELEAISKELEPKFAEKAATISTIAANVTSFLGLVRL